MTRQQLPDPEPGPAGPFRSREKQVAGLSCRSKPRRAVAGARSSGSWWQQQKPLPADPDPGRRKRMVQQVAGQPATVTDSPKLLEFSQMPLALFGWTRRP